MRIQTKFLLTFVPIVVGITVWLAWSSRQVVKNRLFVEKLSQADVLSRDVAQDASQTLTDATITESLDKALVGPLLLPLLLSNQYRTGADYEVVMSTTGDILASTDLALVYSTLLQDTAPDVLRSSRDNHRTITSAEGPILDLARPLYKNYSRLVTPDGKAAKEDELVGWLRVGFKLTGIGESTRQITLSLIYSAVSAIVLLVMFTLSSVRRLTSRIWKLTEQTQSISGGNYGNTVAVESQDELGKLAENFNVMSKSLEETTISKDYFIDIVESMGDPLIVTTTDGVIKTVNKAAELLFGYASGELIGQPARMLVEDHRFFKAEDLRPIIENKRISNMELTFLSKDGKPIPISISAAPLHDASRNVVGCVSIAIDLSEKRKIERQMAQSRKLADKSVTQLRELEDMRQNFFAQITHEFRSPLSAATSIVKMMSKGQFGRIPKKMLDPLVILQNNNERLTRLVDDLLDASKLDSNAMDLVIGDVDLIGCINDVVALFKPLAKENGLTLKAELPEKLMAWADHDKVVHILNNLVSNAVKYTEQGTVTVSLRKTKDHMAEIVVTDTGVGISDEDKARVFDRYFRTKVGGTVAKGTGLGLYVVKTLAELQKGRVEVADNPGGGTRFSFFLPLNATG